MKRAILLTACALAACTRPEAAERTLRQQGYTHIGMGGFAFWGCGKDDTFKTKFTANAPNGEPVSGVVCEGWLKGRTVRLD